MDVKLETFKDICDLTKNRISEIDQDDQIDIIIKNAINQSYIKDLSNKDKRFSSSYCPVINGIATLPDDLRTIESITPALIAGEYNKGNAIFSSRTVTFKVIYSTSPDPLINDTDVPDLLKKYFYTLSTYACYAYYTYRKKPPIAQLFFQEYRNDLEEDIDGIEEYVNNVYSNTGGDDDDNTNW